MRCSKMRATPGAPAEPPRAAAPAARNRRADDRAGRGVTLYDHVQPCIAQPPRRRPRGTGVSRCTTTHSRASRNRRADNRAGRDAAHPDPRAVSAGCRFRAAPAVTRADGRRSSGYRRPTAQVAASAPHGGRCEPSDGRIRPVEPNVDAASGLGAHGRRGGKPAATSAICSRPMAATRRTRQAGRETGGDGCAPAPPGSPAHGRPDAKWKHRRDDRATRSRGRARAPYRPDGGECRSAIMKRLARSR